MNTVLKKNVTVLNHPVINHNLAIIRNKKTDTQNFKQALKTISYALIYEASKNIPTKTIEVETPLMKTDCEVFDDNSQLIIAPILRAGLGFCETASEILPFANIHHIGMYRNEETLEPVWYYDKDKKILEDKSRVYTIILDPMLATGNSALDAVKNFINKGVREENIVFMSLISSPEGIEKLSNAYPAIRIVTASLDKGLNSKGYILPGLGDAGDRIFNTIPE
ncbi:MAG: uracil phosphoribosyltransferase [Candidatus Gastranaerophilales bacterium]|nr:uracil phosphoribosyltransferase [Candidatus Gastranaerophilales bacterium]